MKKEVIYYGGAAALAAVAAAILVPANKKRRVKKNIEKLGGLGCYNYAATQAKKKGLIEEDAKISSLKEIRVNDIPVITAVINLAESGEVSKGPARDERGNFIKTEK